MLHLTFFENPHRALYSYTLSTQINGIMAPRLPSYELRDARNDDYRFAERLYLETMKPLLSRLNALNEPELISNFKQLYEPSDVKIIVVGGVDAGWLQVSEDDQEISLYQIHIEPDYRRNGIGTCLIRDLLTRSRRAHKPVSLFVVRNNPALALYERLGFTVVGEDKTKLFMRWE